MIDKLKNESDTCPCCSGIAYALCCAPYINSEKTHDHPEQLMRSRYVAYTQANMDYVHKTMRDKALQQFDFEHNEQWARSVLWIKLEVITSSVSTEDHSQGFVEYKAYYQVNNMVKCMHEKSCFIKVANAWYYCDNEMLRVTDSSEHKKAKLGRNEPCYCGSGKKYKKCCSRL